MNHSRSFQIFPEQKTIELAGKIRKEQPQPTVTSLFKVKKQQRYFQYPKAHSIHVSTYATHGPLRTASGVQYGGKWCYEVIVPGDTGHGELGHSLDKNSGNEYIGEHDYGILRIGKKQIGHTNFSTDIENRDLCFAAPPDRQFTFACSVIDKTIVVHHKLVQAILHHTDIASCHSIDSSDTKTILLTVSYDKCVWHELDYKSKQRSRRKTSKSQMMEIVDINPVHVLENQLAPVPCVDVSIKSGVIGWIVNMYNASTGEHVQAMGKENKVQEAASDQNSDADDDENDSDVPHDPKLLTVDAPNDGKTEIDPSTTSMTNTMCSVDDKKDFLGLTETNDIKDKEFRYNRK